MRWDSGEPGELGTRGYSVMLGYWNEPDKTADAIDSARWMPTGDSGTPALAQAPPPS